jgi:hypothetical protein
MADEIVTRGYHPHQDGVAEGERVDYKINELPCQTKRGGSCPIEASHSHLTCTDCGTWRRNNPTCFECRRFRRAGLE